jgi:hypothetical protein
MVLLQIIVFILCAVCVWPYTKSHLHPARLMLYSWLFALCLHFPRLIVYEYSVLSFELLLVQTWFVGMFLTGAVIQTPLLSFQQSSGSLMNAMQKMDILVGMLIVLGAVYVSIIGVEIGRKGAAILNVKEMRTEVYDELETPHDAVSLAKAVSRPAVYLLILMSPMFYERIPRGAAFIGFLAAGPGESLLVGGRTFIGFCVAGWVFSWLLHKEVFRDTLMGRLRHRESPFGGGLTIALAAITGGVFFYLFFGVFPSIRNPELSGKEDYYLSLQTGSSVVSPSVRDLAAVTDLDSLVTFAYGTHYATSSMMRCNYLLKETDASHWYFLGGYNFPVVSKLGSLLFGGETSERAAKDKIASSQPFGTNPWIGGVGDVMIDFGIGGGGVFMFLFGLFSGWIYRSLHSLRHPEYLVVAAVISLVLIAFPHSSMIRWSSTTYTVAGCLFLGVCRVFLRPSFVSFFSSR